MYANADGGCIGSKRHDITEIFANTRFELWADIRDHTRGDENRMIQATIEKCLQRKNEEIEHGKKVDCLTC